MWIFLFTKLTTDCLCPLSMMHFSEELHAAAKNTTYCLDILSLVSNTLLGKAIEHKVFECL